MICAEEIGKLRASELKLVYLGEIYDPEMVGFVPVEAASMGNKYLFPLEEIKGELLVVQLPKARWCRW